MKKAQNTLSIIIALSFLTCQSIANAQWWNPIAPKDYDDCVIKNLKSGMGEDAVRALQFSCMQKYPPKTTTAEKLAEIKAEERFKKCRLKKDHYNNHVFFFLERNTTKTNEILSKLKSFKYNGARNSASFQNINSFGMSGVMVGFTNAKQCHQKTEDYRYSTYCRTGFTTQGVASSAFGILNCGELPREAKAMNFCPIGFSPIYNQFNDSLVEFMENNSYCN